MSTILLGASIACLLTACTGPNESYFHRKIGFATIFATEIERGDVPSLSKDQLIAAIGRPSITTKCLDFEAMLMENAPESPGYRGVIMSAIWRGFVLGSPTPVVASDWRESDAFRECEILLYDGRSTPTYSHSEEAWTEVFYFLVQDNSVFDAGGIYPWHPIQSENESNCEP